MNLVSLIRSQHLSPRFFAYLTREDVGRLRLLTKGLAEWIEASTNVLRSFLPVCECGAGCQSCCCYCPCGTLVDRAFHFGRLICRPPLYSEAEWFLHDVPVGRYLLFMRLQPDDDGSLATTPMSVTISIQPNELNVRNLRPYTHTISQELSTDRAAYAQYYEPLGFVRFLWDKEILVNLPSATCHVRCQSAEDQSTLEFGCIWFRLIPLAPSAHIADLFNSPELFPDGTSPLNFLDFPPNTIHCALTAGEDVDSKQFFSGDDRFRGYGQQHTPRCRDFPPVHVDTRSNPPHRDRLLISLKVRSNARHPLVWISLSFFSPLPPRETEPSWFDESETSVQDSHVRYNGQVMPVTIAQSDQFGKVDFLQPVSVGPLASAIRGLDCRLGSFCGAHFAPFDPQDLSLNRDDFDVHWFVG